MQATMANDLDTFESALRLFFQTMKRPQAWSLITERAHVEIDRPAATILMILTAAEPQPYRLQDLASQLNIEAPSVTRKVQQLEQEGYVERQQDFKDKRSFTLKPTESGHQIAVKIRNAQREITELAVNSWTAQERTSFVRLFERFSRDIAALYSLKPVKHT
jgi:DNA-binding MarR family transcriptional regulator